MPSFVLTGTSIGNPSPTDPTNSGTVPHDQEHALVNNEVAAFGGYFNVSAGQANKPQITSAAASNPVVLGAAGSDTNISISITPKGTGGVAILGGLTLSATSIITDTGTGLKIGTATGQKLGFFNATPVVQPSGNALSALSNLGLVSAPTLAQADISGLTTADSPVFANFASGASVSGTNTGDQDLSGLVPKTTTVNGHALSSNVSVTASDVGLGSVENTALSTWAGTANITTLGTIATGVWHGTAIADSYIASASTWSGKQAAYANLTSVGSLANAAGWLHNDGSGAFAYSTPAKSDVGLGSVENTALSTWAGTANITTLGTIGTGVWQGTAIADSYIASASTWSGKAAANQTMYIGTTGVAINRSSANLALTGITSIDGSAAMLSVSGQTGVLSFTGLTSTNRAKTVRDAADTILELGGSYTPSGTWNWTSASATWPTFNQDTTGNAATVTTNANLTGDVTSSGNATSLASTIVTGKVLTGLSVSGSGVLATDSILTAFGKLQNSVNGLAGPMIYQGTWNASTNTPALASGSGTKGYLYKVSVAGTTTIDTISQWNVGDSIVFDGTVWDKIDGVASEVVSFNSRVGAVSLTASDVNTALGFTLSGTAATTMTFPTTSKTLMASDYSNAGSAPTWNQSTTGNAATVTGFSPASAKVLTLSKTMTLTAADDTGVYTLPTGTKTLMASDYSNAGSAPTWNQSTTGSAASLSVSGQTGVLSFTGIASTNRAKTVRDAADTILELGGSYTPSGTWNWASASVTWPTFNQSTTGSAASLSVSGHTGLLSFAGLTTTNRAKTVRDAADTILELGGSYTPSGTWNWTSASVTWPTFNQSTSGNAATVTTNANLTGPITSSGNATSVASQTGTGSKFVMDTSPTLVTPNLGTPSAGVMTSVTGTASGLTAGALTNSVTSKVADYTVQASDMGYGKVLMMDSTSAHTFTLPETTSAMYGQPLVIGKYASGALTIQLPSDARIANGANGGALTATTTEIYDVAVIMPIFANYWTIVSLRGTWTVT